MRCFSNPFPVSSGSVMDSLESSLLGATILTLLVNTLCCFGSLGQPQATIFSSLELLSEFIPKYRSCFCSVELELFALLIVHCWDSEIQRVLQLAPGIQTRLVVLVRWVHVCVCTCVVCVCVCCVSVCVCTQVCMYMCTCVCALESVVHVCDFCMCAPVCLCIIYMHKPV